VTLEELADQVKSCTRCPLRENATSPVAGLGEVGAKYFLLGEAPGKDEDKFGVPFIGLAGKRLNRLLALAGIDPNDCYITNVVKCRPPKQLAGGKTTNRQPRKSERLACYPFLKQELDLVKPKYIITLGATPLSLFTQTGISQLHGTMFNTDDRAIIAHYHPAAALHQPRLWAVMLNDWEYMPEKVEASYTIADPKTTAILGGLYAIPFYIALDTENDPSGKLGVWSYGFRNADKQLYILPLEGKQDILLPPNAVVIMHNAKWDLRVLKNNGMTPPENYVDTMIAAYCLGLGRQDVKDTNRSGDKMVGGLGLKYLARRHLGMEMNTWLEMKDKPDEMAEYNAKDSVATYLLWEKWQPQLPEHFWKIDMPLLPVCMAMEDRGIMVDPNFLKEYAEALDVQLSEINLDGINPYSPKQVIEYVYTTLGVEPTKYTDTGQPSTDAEVLETIDDPIVKGILQYRELYKERKTYVSSYQARMDLENRVRCDFKQTSTATGRLSSARPNLQNVTRGTDLRKLFIAPKGRKLVRLDFSQLELRVFAAISGAKRMLEALEAGRSIHQETADQLGIPYEDAKTVNFLMLYAGGAWKISQEFHIPIDKAKQMIADYYSAYPEIQIYHNQMIEISHRDKRVTNFFGRTRRLDSMYSEHWRTIKEGEREAINTPVQGAAAEIVKLAMIDLHKWEAPMLLQVHDELVFEMEADIADEYANWLREYVPTLNDINGIRFPVDVGVGQNWWESKKNAI